MRSHPVPKVGDTVRINEQGLDTLFNSQSALRFMMKKDLTITYVDSESMTSPEDTRIVEVDDTEINQLMLNHWCFDIV